MSLFGKVISNVGFLGKGAVAVSPFTGPLAPIVAGAGGGAALIGSVADHKQAANDARRRNDRRKELNANKRSRGTRKQSRQLSITSSLGATDNPPSSPTPFNNSIFIYGGLGVLLFLLVMGMRK